MGIDAVLTLSRVYGGIGEIRLATGRPGNALDAAAVFRLRECIDHLSTDARCRVVVLTTAHGDFCTGFDLEYGCSADCEALAPMGRAFWDCMESLASMPKPVIAALRGKVMGGGLGLAAASDLVLATADVKLQLPEVLIGMIPVLVSPFLLRRVMPGRLMQLALGTRAMSAIEAKEMGLVDEIAADELSASVTRHTRRLLLSSSNAMATFKRLMADWTRAEFESRKEQALAAAESWLRSPDVVASLKDFANGLVPSRPTSDATEARA